MYRYASLNDARQRLDGTVILLKGQPIYVSMMTSKTTVEGVNLLDRNNVRLELGPRPEPLRLGYINYQGRPRFVSRKPTRKVRQGLCPDNLLCSDVEIGRVYTSTEFAEMLVNKYPSLNECVEILEREKKGVAFSRLFALYSAGIKGEYKLFYCGNRVGKYTVQAGFALDAAFECLKETLYAST